MVKSKLQSLGFSEGEAEIYTALLEAGQASVVQLAKATGRHRSNIYDTLEKLKEKGLASESIIENRKMFSASDPDNILDYLKEREEGVVPMIAELKEMQKASQKEVRVETYKGKDGLKSILRGILREKKDFVAYGEGTRFSEMFPVFYEQFRKRRMESGMKLRLIAKSGTRISSKEGFEIRFLDFVSPSTTFIYGSNVAIIIWEPYPTAIKIDDSTVADSYMNYFKVMWKGAKK